MFLRRSLAHISNFFLSVHLGVLPPQYQKAGYASEVDITTAKVLGLIMMKMNGVVEDDVGL